MTDFHANFVNIIIASEKGGVRKSTLTLFLATIAALLGAKIKIFEVDDQTRLLAIFGDQVRIVPMPSAEQLLENDQADFESLSPVREAMENGADVDLTFVDLGANLDGRFCEALASLDFAAALVERPTVVLIPYLGDPESVLAAARTAKRFAIALPEARLVFVRCADGGPSDAAFTGDAARAFANDLLPIIRGGGHIGFGRLRPQALAAFDRNAIRPDVFCDLDAHVAAEQLGVSVYVFKSIASQMRLLIASLAEEAASTLGFRRGS